MKTFVTFGLCSLAFFSLSAAANFDIKLSPEGPAESMFHEIYATKEEAAENLKHLCLHFPRHTALLVDSTTGDEEKVQCADVNAEKAEAAASSAPEAEHHHHH